MTDARLVNYLRSRRRRRDLDAFEPLIATPSAFPVTIPANAEVFASYSLAFAVTTHIVTINGDREMHASARAANVPVSLGSLTRAHVVTKNAALGGTVRLYVRDGIGKMFKIAEG